MTDEMRAVFCVDEIKAGKKIEAKILNIIANRYLK